MTPLFIRGSSCENLWYRTDAFRRQLDEQTSNGLLFPKNRPDVRLEAESYLPQLSRAFQACGSKTIISVGSGVFWYEILLKRELDIPVIGSVHEARYLKTMQEHVEQVGPVKVQHIDILDPETIRGEKKPFTLFFSGVFSPFTDIELESFIKESGAESVVLFLKKGEFQTFTGILKSLVGPLVGRRCQIGYSRTVQHVISIFDTCDYKHLRTDIAKGAFGNAKICVFKQT